MCIFFCGSIQLSCEIHVSQRDTLPQLQAHYDSAFDCSQTYWCHQLSDQRWQRGYPWLRWLSNILKKLPLHGWVTLLGSVLKYIVHLNCSNFKIRG